MRLNIRKKISYCLFSLMIIGVTSCTNEVLPELAIDSVSIYTQPDTNDNSAIAVDLVLVYNQELVKIIGQMSASAYFAASKQLLLDNPTLLDIWHWELVPGQIVQDFTPPQEEGDAYAAYVFANYLTPGDHRIKASPEGKVKILLMKDDLINLAKFNTSNVRLGQTMTSASNAQEEDKEDDEERTPAAIKLGPVKRRAEPRVTKTSKPSLDGDQGSLTSCSPLKKLSPDVVRPLGNPSQAAPQQSRHKVKVWRN